jgi:methylaspartate mutase epsilon subunit
VPPCLAVAVNVFEALLAAAAGVRSVTLGYAEQGHRAQDLAAVRVLKSLTTSYLDTFGYADVAVNVVWHQYMGAFPTAPAKARQPLAGSATTAAQSGALRIPDAEDNCDSLRFVQQVVRSGRTRPVPAIGAEDRDEEELLSTECRAIIDHALAACDGDVAGAAVVAVERGWLDIPFSPSRWNAGKVLPLRDEKGAVRFAATGNLPFPADVRSVHKRLVRARMARERRGVEELVEHDIVSVTRGEFDSWPLG